MNFKQKCKQKKDEVDLVAQVGLERESAALRELENRYVLSGGQEEASTNWME